MLCRCASGRDLCSRQWQAAISAPAPQRMQRRLRLFRQQPRVQCAQERGADRHSPVAFLVRIVLFAIVIILLCLAHHLPSLLLLPRLVPAVLLLCGVVIICHLLCILLPAHPQERVQQAQVEAHAAAVWPLRTLQTKGTAIAAPWLPKTIMMAHGL